MAGLSESTNVQALPDLISRLTRAVEFEPILAALQRGESGTIDGAWGSSCALIAATIATGHVGLRSAKERPPADREASKSNSKRSLAQRGTTLPPVVLVVTPRVSEVDDLAADLSTYLPQPPLVFPAWESLPREQSISDNVFGGRLRVLQAVEAYNLKDVSQSPLVIVTAFPALLQPVPSRESREKGARLLKVGETLDLDEFLKWLVSRSFERTEAIEKPGEFSVHGGILDLFPPDAIDPYRIELFGDEIESIRQFDVQTQRKTADLQEARLTVVTPEGDGGPGAGDRDVGNKSSPSNSSIILHPSSFHFVDSLPEGSWILLAEPGDLVEEGKHYLNRLDNPRGLFSVESSLAKCIQRPTVTISALAGASHEITCHLHIESIERFTGPKSEVVKELATVIGREETVFIACHNVGEKERLQELFTEHAPELLPRLRLCVGAVTRGFRWVTERIVVLSDHELFNRVEVRRATKKQRVETRAIESFLDLNEGDLVVHLTHGIARFRGMELIEKEGRREEHLKLEFRDGVGLWVPVSLIHLVQKYVGAAKMAPTLSKLSGTSWANNKKKVAAAVADMASDMLILQAERDAKPGISCLPDSRFVQEFDAAFPYVETGDQTKAIADCKRDLERSRPMDRLICGDVGFGKTEVAMRAAFKMIDSGRQVAMLVPTTILAEQHFRSFCDRMAEFPVHVEVLSRFKTKFEQKRILERMEAGAIDLVIGTHRLVSPDIKFKDLGLLIIDEEQRFGVDAKEMLKRIRLSVDVLTLSATPIPRTLHLSLLGIRDISNLTTAPQDRMAIETRICRWDGSLIRQAVVRELNRGGQIYFVHNRVYNIEEIAERLENIVPEARVAIVHGQMNEHELEENMLAFVRGSADILVATTIIESGLDIPNANTIFIHEAENYGLADLHQLRGRVGRYKHRAYCYLLVDEKKSLTQTAVKRLKAIEEYHELGAGFKIAMRDLEIRGAGNILGTEQSGHISTVGYELYCQLLENAVRALQHLPPREQPHVAIDLPITAFLPNSYVPPGRTKIDVYRKLSTAASAEELDLVAHEIRDRFGPLPPESELLLRLKELQLAAWVWGIDKIHLEDRFAVLGYRDDQKIHILAGRLNNQLRIVDRRNSYLVLPYPQPKGVALLEYLQAALTQF